MALRFSQRLLSAASKKKRFYKDVNMIQTGHNGDGRALYEICLDQRKVKTPQNKVLQVPSEPLALAVCQEWDAQQDNMELDQMQLTGLCMTAMDNPLHKTKELIVDEILNFLPTDTVFFMENEPEHLRLMQQHHWGDLIKWAGDKYHLDIKPTSSLTVPIIPTETVKNLINYFMSYNFYALLGYQYAVEAVKSVLITMATVDSRLSVEDGVNLATLEQRYQTEIWGRVEWAHDVEYHQLCTKLAAGVLFVHFNSTSKLVRDLHMQSK